MEDEEQLPFQFEDNPFAEPVQCDDRLPFQLGQGWIDGPKKEWGRQPNVLHAMPDDTRSEGVQVEEDVGKLRHYGCL